MPRIAAQLMTIADDRRLAPNLYLVRCCPALRSRRMGALHNTEVSAVKSRGLYRIWVRFADGAEGEADLSHCRDDPTWEGLLERWREPGLFDEVQVGGLGIVWGDWDADEDDAISLAGDWLYAVVHHLTAIEMHPELYATQVVEAKALRKYRVWVRFADGTEGTADLGDFVGKGVFRQWDHPGVWEGMRVSRHTLEWGSDNPTEVLDLCPEMLYSRVSGVSREEMESPDFAQEALKRLSPA